MKREWLVLAFVLTIPLTLHGGGFQVAAQGARAMGMGLAYTAVANDASAIYYNPAGLAMQTENDLIFGGMLATNLEGTFESTGTPPGSGIDEAQRESLNTLPQTYISRRGRGAITYGIGMYTPFGLPMRWEDPDTFSGRFISQTALLRTVNINPTVAFQITPDLAIGIGGDYMYSKVQLERNQRGTAPLPPLEIAHVKLSSEQLDNSGWGWNAGLLWKVGLFRLGASYRSAIDVDHEGEATFTQILTGNAQVDAAVRANLPAGAQRADVSIEYPSSLNLGVAFMPAANTTLAIDAHRTNWSSFGTLDVFIGGSPVPSIHREASWENAWAYRAGVELPCGPIICRAGYYRDETPQPIEDIGPVLPDADRQGFALGLSIGLGRLTLDLANIYIRFDERTTNAANRDRYFGTYETTANEFAVNLHWR